MIRLGSAGDRRKLVAEFGGFWPEHGIWTEEQVDDEPVGALIHRMLASGDPEAAERDRRALAAPRLERADDVLRFLEPQRPQGRSSGRRGSTNIAIARHDYQESSRLISVSRREPFESLGVLFAGLYERFVVKRQRSLPILRGVAAAHLAFAAVIEALGEADAIPLLWRSLGEMRELARDGGDPAGSPGGTIWQRSSTTSSGTASRRGDSSWRCAATTPGRG